MTRSRTLYASRLIRLAAALGAALVALLSTQVAAAQTTAPAPRPPSHRVLVLPFAADNVPEQYRWLGRGVQQSLATDLAQSRGVELLSARDAAAVDTTEAALDAARRADATDVVFGSLQIVESDVRMTGQVLDVRSGQRVGSLKATGGVRDVFHLEDALAAQVQDAIGLPSARADARDYPGARSYEDTMDDANYRRLVPDSYSLPYYDGYDNAYVPSYDYGPDYYPYYSYGYPIYGYPFLSFSFRNHGFFHRGGFVGHGGFGHGTFGRGGFGGRGFGGGGFHGGGFRGGVGGGMHAGGMHGGGGGGHR